MGILENSLPSFWKPGLSRLFAVESDQATLKIPKSTTPTEKAAKAKGHALPRGVLFSDCESIGSISEHRGQLPQGISLQVSV